MSSSQRALTVALLCAVAVGAALLGVELRDNASRYLNVDSPLAFVLVPLRRGALMGAAASLGAALFLARRWWSSGVVEARLGLPLRGLLHAGLLAFLAASLSHALGGPEWPSFAVSSVFWSVLLLGVSTWTALLALYPVRLFRRTTPAALDVALLNILLVLVLAEAGLGLYARLRPSQILWDDDSVSHYVASRRLAPEALLHGFRVNSGGFPDREFFDAGPNDISVALLSDSFGIGIVHYDYNFATVAERHLAEALAAPERRVAIDNYSVTGIGMSGYAWLLENEVLPRDPSLVVLSIFVGNDISGFDQHRARFTCLQYLRLYKTPRRLLKLRQEQEAGGRIAEFGSSEATAPPSVEEEVPTLSEEAFLEIELERMERSMPDHRKTARHFEGFFAALAYFQQRVGGRLLVVVIPDEYQVNDPLYTQLLERVPDPGQVDRFYPQRRIQEFCEERDLECLDLLEVLRRAQREERVYHLRDTHWNARGNRTAGEAIADAILSRFSEQTAGSNLAP